MQIGTHVRTEHGTGRIVGKDLPESTCWRWIVEIKSVEPASAEIVSRFAKARLCFFPHEVTMI